MKTPIKIDATEWTVTEILPISMSGPLTDIKIGSVRVTHAGNERPKRFSWRAQRVDNHWKIMGDGAVMPGGNRVKDAEKFPFTTDAVFNLGLSKIVREFIDEELGITSSEPKRVEIVAPRVSWKPAVTISGNTPKTDKDKDLETESVGRTPTPQPTFFKITQPEPPPVKEAVLNSDKQTGSLADRVAAKVCGTYEHMAIADMRDSKNRVPHSRARQIVVYLLRELGQKNHVILAAIGASETVTSLVYTNHNKIKELVKTDSELRVKINVLRKEFGLSDLEEMTATTTEPERPEQPSSSELKQPPAGGKLIVPAALSNNGNGLIGRITSLVSEIVCAPILAGTETTLLDLGPARMARTYLLFDLDRNMTPEKISVGTGLEINAVNRQIVEVLGQLRNSESEVSRIVSQVKKRLASEAAV